MYYKCQFTWRNSIFYCCHLLLELEGGGNGGEVLDGDHLLLHHCLKLPNGVIHDVGKLKAQEQLKLSSSGPGPGLTLKQDVS